MSKPGRANPHLQSLLSTLAQARSDVGQCAMHGPLRAA